MPKLTTLPAWKALEEHYRKIEPMHMRDLFAEDPNRFRNFSMRWGEILFDYSKNRITPETMELLFALASQVDVPEGIRKMYAGERINSTEDRPALHIALRNRSNRPIEVEGEDVMPQVNSVLGKMRRLCERIRNGEWVGYSGEPVTDIVNIGIGGSNLGPSMVCEALKAYSRPNLRVHFVSNVDGTDISEVLKTVRPETTLFLVASKSFTTQETRLNANTAKEWLLRAARRRSAVPRHFIAISTNRQLVADFGIDVENMLEFWDWVGGRYSLWSAIGFSIALYLGMDLFEELLAGAHAMDEHFRTTSMEDNIPVIMALLGVWYNNFFGAESHAVLPYDQYLHRFPAHLQQMDMESNGKRVTRSGETVDYPTGPIIWGEPGTDGQHAFFQLIHQGTRLVPADFIAPVNSLNPVDMHHVTLLANFFAQTEALMRGKTAAEVVKEMAASGKSDKNIEALLPHRVFPGNRPTNSLLIRKLTPRTLGSLIALYEHRTYVQGLVWDVNSFDQWGVELGKELARTVLADLHGAEPVRDHDASTNGLINWFKEIRVESES